MENIGLVKRILVFFAQFEEGKQGIENKGVTRNRARERGFL